MKRSICILGSTGSIGKSSLYLINKYKSLFDVQILMANSNFKLICEQIKKYKPEYYIINDYNIYLQVKDKFKNNKIKIINTITELKPRKKIDIFCLTSKYDGTPNVLGEAISYKIPCLSPKNVGCSNELLGNGKYGELYEQNNQKDFLKKLKIIIKKYRNSITKAEKAYKGLEKYNKSSTLSKLEKKLISF